MWVNSSEIAGNGLDDDDNGYIDDIYGYDFYNDDHDPLDDDGHGTHCAGIIAASGNNGTDIAGVCWNARIMALKFLGVDTVGTMADSIEAFYYAVENGADVISNSWGSRFPCEPLKEIFEYVSSQGVINVFAAGNSGRTRPYYPAYYDHVIAVAATNSNSSRS
jgi:subtilisin family serine protease